MKKTKDIWLEYHKKLFAFIKSRVGDSDAEDILQDVFVKIHTKIDSLKETAKLESWLYQITRNAIIDYYRSKRMTEELSDWIGAEETIESDNIRQEFSACILPMIEQLPDKYRSAVRLSEIEGKTQKEVAEREKISLSGAKSRVQRGRVLLKGMLHDCCKIELNHRNQLISYEQKKRKYKCP
ncbi:MAG: RNA polymerase sigma factor SigZ [Lentisphaerae bacterium]|nr:RNA polymerase sigma factor SigZ [Lentisphaerota bacterium]MCP4103373.1 RNA polymerase sigma factor SigZ [Lentisphaerota bacterium]